VLFRSYAAASEPKRLLLVDRGTHNNCLRVGSSEYRSAMHELFGLKPKTPPRNDARS